MSARNTVVEQEPETSTRPLPPPDPALEAEGGAPDGAEEDLKALGRQALDSADKAPVPGVAEVPAPAPRPDPAGETDEGQFDLARVAWLATVLSCLLAAVILALDGYAGYAGVTGAVALAAAINLF
jgi:hypothetical protein